MNNLIFILYLNYMAMTILNRGFKAQRINYYTHTHTHTRALVIEIPILMSYRDRKKGAGRQ